MKDQETEKNCGNCKYCVGCTCIVYTMDILPAGRHCANWREKEHGKMV